MKKFFFILLVILMPIVAKADGSGKCGNNLTWTFVESTGTLTISGTGAMKDYSYDSVPWYNYSSEILKTEIGDGVTSIGEHAFYGCSSLVSVSIPEGVTSIGDYAFYENFNLASISIPNSVMSVGEQAFRCCSNLTSITIPNGVTSIGGFAFEGCSFRELHIPSSLTKIGRGAFGVQSGLLKITVDDNNPVYNDDGDVGGLSLDAVFEKETKKLVVGGSNTTIPGTITKIGPNAFHNCTDLTSIYLRNIAEIDTAAFYGCSNLKTIYLPDALKIINNGAFGLTGLTSITTPEGLDSIGYEAFVKCEKLTKAEINGRAIFGSSLFGGCSSLNEIIIGKTVKSIDMKYGNFFRSLFYHGCPQDLKISVDSRNTNYDSRNNCNAIIETATNTLIQGWNLTTIPESVTSIGSSAFSDCSSLTSITLPESVTSIGSFAFSDCCNLTSITIPEGVTSISGSVFYGCSSLTSITIPESVTSIGEYAFYSCSSLTSITIPESVTSIGDAAFYSCSSLTSITIPESVTSIGDAAFYKCSSLTSVTMGASTPVDITSNVFPNRTNATLYVPYGSKEAYMAASYWSEFKEIVELAPEDITFADAKVKEVCVANWDTNGDGELSMQEAEAVNDLGEVFKGNTEITSFDELQYFTSLTSIGDNAFSGCRSLTSITIPDGVTSIGGSAFVNCNSLEEVHITDIAAWCNIKFNNSYSNPLSYAHHLYLNGNEVINLVIPDGVTSIGDWAFSYCSSLTSIIIPKGVTSIGDCAFRGCSSLASITIPDGVTSIGKNTFYDCSSLTSITIPDGTTSIGNSTFYGCSNLTSITIPESVTSIGNSAFYECSSLTSITIPESVTSIDNSAFSYCSSLTSITIPESVTSIGGGAFYKCSSLTSITLLKGVTSIDHQAFYGCSSLTTITIPEGVTSIGISTFEGCSSLTSITIPESVTSIVGSAFYGCSNLTSVTMGASTPVDITSDVFSNRTNATLYVPYGSKEAYMAASYWNEFKEIVELAPEYITFADAKVKEICVANWDTNGDGELSMKEAEAVTVLGWTFTDNGEITSFDELQYFTGLTSIDDYNFRNCSGLTSITLPNSLTSIEFHALSGCSGLTSITLPNSVTSIDNAAFYCCSGLTSITLPETLTSLGDHAFSGCSALTSITLPSSLTSIGIEAFYKCSSLTSVTVGWTTTLPSIEETTFTNRTNATLYVPAGTKALYKAASYWNEFKEIVEYGATTTTTITFVDAKVKELCIANWDTNGDGELSIEEAEAVTDLGGVFKYNEEITSFNELNYFTGLTSIGYDAFSWCTYLTSITIPKSVTSIGDYAFCNCSSLTSITIPDGVTSIGDWTFVGCTSLTSINIPESVTSIGYYAFRYCSSLTSITIPESVTSIGDEAFYQCSSLTSVTMGASTPVDITSNVFSNRANATLYVPYGSKEAYMAASYWNEFKEIVEYEIPTEITITINQYGSGTYCSDLSLDFTNVKGLTAYVAGGFNTRTTTVMMYKVNTTKPNTGLFIKGEPGEYVVPVLESSDDNYMNMLVGTTEKVTVNSKSADGNYVNFKYTIKSGDQKPRFYEFTDGSTLSANKAYLQVPASWLPATSEARTMNIMFDDEDVTGIEENYEFGNMNSDGSVYDLSGRKVNNPTKGMYIVNGKKVVIK